MADRTGIEWTDASWNPTTGCDKISAGCDNCYALQMAKRLKAMGSAKYQNDGDPRTSGPGFGLTLHPSALDIPKRWRTPRMIFVNSMSDLFHARVPLLFVRAVFAAIADTPQHTYQVLTKRARRMRHLADQLDWPPNLWMGVSVEDSTELHRVDELRRVPAALRFLSCEPLLGPLADLDLTGIGWVIAGGESGADARPMHPDWARDLRDRCGTVGIPFHFKQWGEWSPANEPWRSATYDSRPAIWITKGGTAKPWGDFTGNEPSTTKAMYRVGKKSAGRVLDGRTWDEFPEPHRVEVDS